MSEEMALYTDVCAVADIPWRGSRVVKTSNGCVALFRSSDDSVYALDDRCPHKNGPLSQGIVHDRSVTCPLHNWVFDLSTGIARGEDEGEVATYPVEVVDGRVLIDLRRLDSKAA